MKKKPESDLAMNNAPLINATDDSSTNKILSVFYQIYIWLNSVFMFCMEIIEKNTRMPALPKYVVSVIIASCIYYGLAVIAYRGIVLVSIKLKEFIMKAIPLVIIGLIITAQFSKK
jgi:hypothetical protein